jgi:hypothetical protein
MQAGAATESQFGFYRFQYGINFRRWDGRTYSDKDPLKRKTTRNLGVIMEASVDRFAQELAEGVASASKLERQNEWTDFVRRECLGQLTEEDLKMLKRIQKIPNKYNRPDSVRDYLKNLRLFAEYLTFRYRRFLPEFDPEGKRGLHQMILQGILFGKMRHLVKTLDHIQQEKQSFKTLFKSTDY